MSKRFRELKKSFGIKTNHEVRNRITFMKMQTRIAKRHSLNLYSRLHVKHGKVFKKEMMED